jgi:hypothetical protein
MDLSLIECTDKDQWDRFASESPHGSVYCSTSFLDALGEEYRLLLAVDANREPLAGAVLILRAGQPYPGQFPLTMYQGILLGSSVCRQPAHSRTKQTLEVLDYLLAQLEKRYERIAVCQHHRFEDLRALSWFHYHEPDQGRFRMELQYSGLLALAHVANFDQYFASIRPVRRNEYRRSQTSGFTVRPSTDVELLDQLHRLTFARQGIEREPEEVRLLQAIAQAALAKGFGELLTCLGPDGKIASAILFLCDRSCAYYWVAANDPDYRKSGCATYLMVEGIRHWHAKGVAALDFVGINSPNRGDFKTSFNAVPVPYVLATWERPAASRDR